MTQGQQPEALQRAGTVAIRLDREGDRHAAETVRAMSARIAELEAQPAPSAAADLIAALEEARSAINSMKVEAETAGQGDEQMMLEACETISNEGLQADIAIRAALASAPQPSPTPQADSQPAEVWDYPPLPDFDTVEQHIYGACRRYITQDMLEPIHNLIRDAIDADRAAQQGYDAARLEIESLKAQLDAISAGVVEPLRRRECLHQIVEPAPAGEYPALPERIADETVKAWQERGDMPGYAFDFRGLIADGIRRASHGKAPAHAAEEQPLPLLVRDIAADLGTTPVQVCIALSKLGFAGHSVNMVVTPQMAKSLRAHFATTAQAAPADPLDTPLPCDLTAGGVTIGKGCPLRTVQHRLQVQADANVLLMRTKAAPAVGLKDHEVAALVNRLRDVASQFRGTRQLRERIASEIRPVAHALAAPAAQEDAARYNALVSEAHENKVRARAFEADAARWRWLSEHIIVAWNDGKFTSLVRIVSDKNRASLNASVDRMMAGDWSDADAARSQAKEQSHE